MGSKSQSDHTYKRYQWLHILLKCTVTYPNLTRFSSDATGVWFQLIWFTKTSLWETDILEMKISI